MKSLQRYVTFFQELSVLRSIKRSNGMQMIVNKE